MSFFVLFLFFPLNNSRVLNVLRPHPASLKVPCTLCNKHRSPTISIYTLKKKETLKSEEDKPKKQGAGSLREAARTNAAEREEGNEEEGEEGNQEGEEVAVFRVEEEGCEGGRCFHGLAVRGALKHAVRGPLQASVFTEV
jgi:hypothetical protein